MPQDKIKLPPVQSKYYWNATRGRYVNSETGRVISSKTIRNELEKLMKLTDQRMYAISQALVNGELSLVEWQLAMMENIKNLHIAASASANGGWAQMSQSDWGFTGARIRNQYKYLKNFANQIYTGEQPLTKQIIDRSKMYFDASRGTYEAMRTRYEETENGMEEERRLLGEADHCPGCLEQAAKGWQPIGTLDEIGDEECLTNCHCTKQYRKKNPNGRGYILSEEE